MLFFLIFWAPLASGKEEEILKRVQEPPKRRQDGPKKYPIEDYENSPAHRLAGSLFIYAQGGAQEAPKRALRAPKESIRNPERP